MSSFLDTLSLDPRVKQGLPLAYVRIFVNDEIIGAAVQQKFTLVMPKYRQASMGVRPAMKPISKLEL